MKFLKESVMKGVVKAAFTIVLGSYVTAMASGLNKFSCILPPHVDPPATAVVLSEQANESRNNQVMGPLKLASTFEQHPSTDELVWDEY
jgi:hypothetical protein